MSENCEDDTAAATSCNETESLSTGSYALENIMEIGTDKDGVSHNSDAEDLETEKVTEGEDPCGQYESNDYCVEESQSQNVEEHKDESDPEMFIEGVQGQCSEMKDTDDFLPEVDATSIKQDDTPNGTNVEEDIDNSCSEQGSLEKTSSETEKSESKNKAEGLPEGESQTSSLDPLPECRNKRSYVCGFCNMKTYNPREYLYHLKDTHGENIRIFECSLCIYASKTHQKLVRHNHMVHKVDLHPEGSEQKKKNKEKEFKPTIKKIKASPISSRSPRESKSPRRFEEYEFINDSELDFDEPPIPSKNSTSGKPLYYCNQCKFSTFSTKVLAKHENKYHLKRRFYKCTRCNYATQVKARYTKHMKYHQLPIIKCEWCDFRTPYRWNLDRHTKNHTEEVGEHRCHLCNFTAQIKQSLTVHVANHHLTPEQIKEKESKRVIGICDPEDCLEEDEMELLRMERDEDPDALELPYPPLMMSSNQTFTVSNIDMGSQEDFESSLNGSEDALSVDEPKRKKPKIKITLKKMKPPKDTFFQELNERHNFEDDFIHPDDVVHRHGNVYIKTEKCNLCSFKAPFPHEIERHQKKVHGTTYALKSDEPVKKVKKSRVEKSDSSENSSSDSSSEGEKRKYSPLTVSNDVNSNFIEDKSDMEASNDNSASEKYDEDEKSFSNKEDDSSSKESTPVKKRSSFFDKLQEKLSSSNVQNLVCQYCGHESKCLSESVRHQKLHLSAKNLYATPSLSTRCQFCRHRCKTTDDLINHLKLCPEARKNQISDNMVNEIGDEGSEEGKHVKNSSPKDADSVNIDMEHKHPMENKVFVWNNISNYEEEMEGDENGFDGKSSETQSENASSVPDSDNHEEHQYPNGENYKIKKVYRCPQCKFWASTASRFHIHIIGHYNTKPFRCSECGYRSNWRWDITKHIKLKIPKDINHQKAEPCLVNENGDKNYDKYEKYLVEVRMDGRTAASGRGGGEGSAALRRGRPKRITPDNDGTETDSSKSSPCPTPLTVPLAPTSTSTPSTGPSTIKIPAPPKLMRAPNRQFTSSPGPNPFGPINPGAQMMAEMGSANTTTTTSTTTTTTTTSSSENDAIKKKLAMKPPPLVAMGTFAQQQQQQQLKQQQQQQPQLQPQQTQPQPQQQQESPTSGVPSVNDDDDGEEEAAAGGSQDSLDSPKDSSGSNYQIITPQGALHTSLETLQLLAAGSTNLAKLKRQQREAGEGKNPELDAAVANQMRLILWLTCLTRETESKENKEAGNSSGDPPISSIMQLVLDHEGNPEWKCLNCDFRDNEQETVVQHVRLAHGKKGPVSLLHAVHRCSVCGFAAGTKRHAQVHLETAHNGQGGIISRSEGQNIDPESGVDESSRSFDCRLCPFTCKKRGELKNHLSHHTPRVDYVFKCMFCPYYVATKNELFNHLSVHGMDIPPAAKQNTNEGGSAPIPTMINSMPTEESGARHFVCDLCPFETRSRAKLMHHRQFHRPRGLPFSCPHCSYNVTRRHLLAQHLRIHGVSPTDGIEGTDSQGAKSKMFSDESSFSRSKSPSPSLTITPINSSREGNNAPPKIDPDCLPTLSDELTKNLHDIPLVWVSRDNRFFKMFKCRHCPHVNLRKTNIQEHEKMHRPDGLVPGTGHACQYCSYICINAGVMSAHLKVHSGSMGKCHAIVDQALPNEEQLHMLAGSGMKKAVTGRVVSKGDEKLLYYCQNCPGRFFFEKEVQIHSRFHISNAHFTHHCSKCNFGARDESQILAHAKVHTPEYQERTRTLMTMHPSAPLFPPVPGLSVPQEAMNSSPLGLPHSDNGAAPGSSKGTLVNGFSRPWLNSPTPNNSSNSSRTGNMPQPPPTSRFKCDQCPSTFSKLITLQYHQSLHSADNPFKCNRCTYAAKTQDGLQQHITLHEQAELEKSSGSFLSPSPSPVPSPSPLNSSKKSLEDTLGTLTGKKPKKGLMDSIQDPEDHPPIKLKFIGLKGASSSGSSKKQFKYYIEEQVPLSGVELLKRKNQIEREMPKDATKAHKIEGVSSVKPRNHKTEDRSGNPKLHYPLHIDKSSGRSREKRYKCSLCPSAFEKSDQFNVHLNLHGSNYKYKCRICDYSVKFYANFMMHIKRHKYHEKMDAQKNGHPPPLDDQMKYEPLIGDNPTVEESRGRDEISGDKENQIDFDAYPDMTTAEKQQLILQQKKADAFKLKDEEKDRRIFYCQYCPYANMRRDAVDSHSLRHQANMGRGLYQCNFCDYTASQPNFIREHTKVHFRPFKYVQPEGFMRHDKLEIWSIKSGETVEEDEPKKSLVFGHEESSFTPGCMKNENERPPEAEAEAKEEEEEEKEGEVSIDSQVESGILVDFRSGDVVEAPSNFIIPMRPKGKSTSVPCSGSGSGKQKSKYMKARKKTKLGNRIMSSSEVSAADYETPVEKTEMDEDRSADLADFDQTALSNQESYNNSPSPNSVSLSNNGNEDDNAEQCNDDMNGDLENCQEMETISNGDASFAPVAALNH